MPLSLNGKDAKRQKKTSFPLWGRRLAFSDYAYIVYHRNPSWPHRTRLKEDVDLRSYHTATPSLLSRTFYGSIGLGILLQQRVAC